jgi:hypothetical protein
MAGKEPLARGPVVVLRDESASMRDDGKDLWSKAVALALLSTATRQKRAWHLVSPSTAALSARSPSRKGHATLEHIEQALDHRCRGGTNFDTRPVLRRAIGTNPDLACTMNKGRRRHHHRRRSHARPTTRCPAARALTESEGVSYFAVGVGSEAASSLQALAPIATSMVRITNTDDADPIIPVINLDPQLTAQQHDHRLLVLSH